jgi:hypothetical protein
VLNPNSMHYSGIGPSSFSVCEGIEKHRIVTSNWNRFGTLKMLGPLYTGGTCFMTG